VNALLRAAQPLPLVLARLIQVWSVSPRVGPNETVCQALARERLACYKGSGDWNDLRRYDRPAILTLSSGRGGVQHVLLRELGASEALIETASTTMRLPLEQVDLLWTGEFLVLFHRDVDEVAVGPDSKAASLAWLRVALGRAQGRALPAGVKYDEDLKQALMHYQSAQGLTPDGIAGARTLIDLSTLTPPAAGTPTLKALDVPHP
jgi:general secretion pathway protein A